MATAQTGQGVSMLDAAVGQIEHAVNRVLDFEVEMARRAEQQWLEAQAEILRDLTSSYASAARTLLK